MNQFEDLKGKTLIEVKNVDDEELVFVLDGGVQCKFHHYQDCCERVWIEDINGNLDDLMIWNVILTDSQIQQLYNNGLSIDPITDSSYPQLTLQAGTEIYFTNSSAKIGGSMYFDGSTYYTTASEEESTYDFDNTVYLKAIKNKNG